MAQLARSPLKSLRMQAALYYARKKRRARWEAANQPDPPEGYVFLVDADGAYLLDSDGGYLVEAM